MLGKGKRESFVVHKWGMMDLMEPGLFSLEKGGWRETLTLSTTTWKQVVARWILITFPK